MRVLIKALALALGLLSAPQLLAQAPAAKPPLVLAAASLQEAINAEANAWAAKHHPRPVISLAASSALARQVENGAPADLFVSADEEWMDYLATRHLITPGTRSDVVANTLVLIAPVGKPVMLHIARHFALAAALGGGRLAVADTNAVPAGKYAKAALTSLGVWASVVDHLASGDSVRSALALVARGEAPLGIVYATDAKAEPRVQVVGTFPASSHAPILYPLARLSAASSADAEGFRAFLLSGQGQAIFRAFGFSVPTH